MVDKQAQGMFILKFIPCFLLLEYILVANLNAELFREGIYKSQKQSILVEVIIGDLLTRLKPDLILKQ